MTEPIVTTKMNYPGNSEKSKAATTPAIAAPEEPGRKAPEQITTGTAQQRKKTLGRKFMETFVSGDDSQSVGQYVMFEVIVPAAKTMASDAIREAVERFLFGGGQISQRGGPRFGNGANRPHTSYQTMYSAGASNNNNAFQDRPAPRRGSDFQNIIIDTRPEAVDVLESLRDLIDEYQAARVEDLYSMVGITGTFVDTTRGWRDLSGANIRRGRNGYVLDLPDPIDLR